MKNAYIFDFDGTIGNTIPLVLESFSQSFRDLNFAVPSKEDLFSKFGPSEDGFFNQYSKEKGKELFNIYLKYYDKWHSKYSPEAFEGIKEIFDYIKSEGDYLGLITGKCMQSAIISFKYYNIDIAIFDYVKTGEPCGNIKQIAMKEASKKFADAKDIYYVGDAVSDIIDSKATNLIPLAAAWAESANKEALLGQKPYKLFESTKELASWLTNSQIR